MQKEKNSFLGIIRDAVFLFEITKRIAVDEGFKCVLGFTRVHKERGKQTNFNEQK